MKTTEIYTSTITILHENVKNEDINSIGEFIYASATEAGNTVNVLIRLKNNEEIRISNREIVNNGFVVLDADDIYKIEITIFTKTITTYSNE